MFDENTPTIPLRPAPEGPRRSPKRIARDVGFAALIVLVVAVPVVLLARQGGSNTSSTPPVAQATGTSTGQLQSTPTAATDGTDGTVNNQTGIPPELGNCTPKVLPVGQSDPSAEPEPMGPTWCFPLVSEPTTRITSGDSWVDDFNTGIQMGHLNDNEMGYRVYSVNGVKSEIFVNNNHWMPDLLTGGNGGNMIRPDRSFTYQNGKLIVEADVAAGISDYGGDIWPEIDISTSPNPTQMRTNGLYGYDMFTGSWVLGCRLQSSDRNIVCSMFNPQSTNDADSGRLWEIEYFKAAPGGKLDGGYPQQGNICNESGQCVDASKAFRVCKSNQMDMYCRDRFRLELTRNSLTVYINGYKYMSATLPGNAAIPDAMLNGQNYVYFTSWAGHDSTTPVARFHWDRLAVNPVDQNGNPVPPSSGAFFCLSFPQGACPAVG